MLPVLFSIGPFTMYTYGIFLFTALFLTMFVIWKRGREAHFDEAEVLQLGLQLLFWGIVGARIAYVLTHLSLLQYNIFQMVNIFSYPGYEPFGGMLAMFVVYILKLKKLKWEMWLGMDVLVTGLILWNSIMGLADFFNGSGAGMPTTSFIGVYFSGMYEKRVPIQLLEFALYAALFVMLWRVESHYRTFGWYKGNRSEANSGFISATAFLFMGIIMLITELFRPAKMLLFNSIRLELLIALSFLLAGLVVFQMRSGSGLVGIVSTMLSDWGVTGSLVDAWKKNRKSSVNSRLKLGRDIFD
jgi:phosphatidylglycerol---prolipoprotein diacylglyceryl transferase